MREQLPDRRLDWRSPATHELSNDERGVTSSRTTSFRRSARPTPAPAVASIPTLTAPDHGQACNWAEGWLGWRPNKQSAERRHEWLGRIAGVRPDKAVSGHPRPVGLPVVGVRSGMTKSQ
jgi:hypothetical protein